MERVAFLLEKTGERLGCLLNPDSLVVRRTPGLRPRRSAGAAVTGHGLLDDPLLFTGGGTTELNLELLFDVSIPGSTVATEDVRDLTKPLWDLAENSAVIDGYSQPPMVRFVWGKAWNVPGVVAGIAERLEHFTQGGSPRRSWLRMRLLRVSELAGTASSVPSPIASPLISALPALSEGAEVGVHEVLGEGGRAGEMGAPGERLDELAHRYLGDSSLWRLLAAANGITDPLNVQAGTVLKIPPRASV